MNGSGYVVPAFPPTRPSPSSAWPRRRRTTAPVPRAPHPNGARSACGSQLIANSGTADAIVDLDVGRPCYAVDDNTVAHQQWRPPPVAASSARWTGGLWSPRWGLAGRRGAPRGRQDYLYLAGADLSTTGQFPFVKLNGSSAIVSRAPRADTPGRSPERSRRRGRRCAAAGLRVVGGATIADGALLATQATTARAKGAVVATVDASGASATAASTGSFWAWPWATALTAPP